jgi:hypothetical protein
VKRAIDGALNHFRQHLAVSFAHYVTIARRVALLLLILAAARCARECADPLAPKLPSARFAPETWLIDFGLPDFRTHLVSGWGADERWGEQQVAFVWSTGSSSILRLNRYGENDVKLRFRCMPKNAPQVITTLVNGAQVAQTALAPDFAVHEIAVPAARLRLGENQIEFRYQQSGAVAWDWLEILEPRARPNMRTPHKTTDDVIMPYRSALRFELDVMPESALVIDALDVEGRIASEDRGRVLMTVRAPDGRTLASFDAAPDGKAQRFSLPPAASRRAQLEILIVAPRAGTPTATAVILRKPGVVHHCK